MKRTLPRVTTLTATCSVLFISLAVNAATTLRKPAAGHAGTTVNASPLKKTTISITAPPDIQVATDPMVNSASNVALGTPVVTSDNASYSITNNAPASFPIGITNVTWIVADDKGNTATTTQKVTVADKEKPYISQLFEIGVVNDPGQCGAVVKLIIPETYDNSGEPVMLTNNAPAYFNVGSTIITWTATDRYGNTETMDQVISVIDNELPTITTKDIRVNNDPGKNGAAVNLGTPVTGDNCGVISITNDAPAFFPIGTTIVHWTVADNVYTNACTQVVTVVDAEKPSITPLAAVTINNEPGKCGASVALKAPAATDNSGVVTITNNAPAIFPGGVTVVTWTATDKSGNQSTATQNVTVKDVEAPVMSVPANVTVSCSGIPAAMAPNVVDNCTASPTISFSEVSTRGTDPSRSSYYNYTITRTWIARDASNNSTTGRQVITVQDRTAPAISAPDISVSSAANSCSANVNFTVTASDNCGSPVTLTYSKVSGSSFSTGLTTVTVTAKDISGNTSTQSFTVTVVDMQNPTITAPNNVTVTANTGNSATNVNLGNPVTKDNCGVRSVSNDAPSSFPVGTTVVTWTVTDINNNKATATQTVTVNAPRKRTAATGTYETTGRSAVSGDQPATEDQLNVIIAPNPSTTCFTLKFQSRLNLPVDLRVTDAAGRMVDSKSKLGASGTVQVGANYLPGIYYAEFIQGSSRKTLQLMKLR